ncbi:MAG: hypothetical protein HY263_03385 [Chloroflexi bacterium]|nr:hypothetical protein [Chloroflexota bacterium]
MNASGRPALATATPGDFHGRATLRLASPSMWLEVLAAGGPRIVRLGLAGSSANLLAETPDLGWETAHGRYELLGGHRLWFAPEDSTTVAVPDGDGLAVEAVAGGLRLTGQAEPSTGIVRSLEIRLDPASASFAIRHELRNRGHAPIELAPWSITQLPLGGRVLMPQRRAAAGHHVRPNRNLVLWPYTSWEDDRIIVRDGVVVVRGEPGEDLKVGCFTELGWVAYERGGIALVRRFEPALGQRHPDLECNVETYCGSRYLELEILAPLRTVAPGGGSAVLQERWELRLVGAGRDDVVALVAELSASADEPLPRTA